MGQFTNDLLSVGKGASKLLWTNRSVKQKLGLGATSLYLGGKYLLPDTVSGLTKEKNKIEDELKKLKAAGKENTIKRDEALRKEKEYNDSVKQQREDRIKREKEEADKKNIDPTKPKIPKTDSEFNPYVLGGVAAAGLGYLALKRMRAKRAERKFAESDFNRQYS